MHLSHLFNRKLIEEVSTASKNDSPDTESTESEVRTRRPIVLKDVPNFDSICVSLELI